MGEVTHISWADHTFNPWIGCTEVSVGEKGACVGCYARELAARYGFAQWGDHPRHRTSEANWRKPLSWNRKAGRDGTRPFVFCSSLADVFDNQVDPAWRRDLFDLIRATPNLTWLLLTKRPQNIERLYLEAMLDPPDGGGGHPWPANAAIGCTVVTQAEADRDIVHLARAKAALKPAFAFLSMEPLMEAVDLEWPVTLYPNGPPMCCDGRECGCMGQPTEPPLIWYVDWVITGGETDQGKFRARPSHPDWFRSLRDQCAAAGVAYHHKQNGEWAPGECATRPTTRTEDAATLFSAGDWHFERITPSQSQEMHTDDAPDVWRLGKKAAGRMLDGIVHDARPVIA